MDGNKTMHTKFFCAAAMILTLSGCSHNLPIETNLDKDKVDAYFEVSGVKVLTNQELSNYAYKILGTVEGNTCQIDADNPPPKTSDARVNARKQAAKMGGNAIVFSTCAEFGPSPACLASVSCYGKAVYLSQEQPIK